MKTAGLGESVHHSTTVEGTLYSGSGSRTWTVEGTLKPGLECLP